MTDKENLISQALNSISEADSDDIEKVFGALLSLPDDQFDALAPQMLLEIEKQLNNNVDKLAIAGALNANGINTEEFKEQFSTFIEEVDNMDNSEYGLSQSKKDFVKSIMALIMNAVEDTEGISKRKINIPIELCREGAKVPTIANLGDAGADIYAVEDFTLAPGEQKMIPTGLKVQIPLGYALLVHPRSGLSARTHLRICNSIGLIDAGYRDEICILFENNESPIIDAGENGIAYGKSISFSKGDRIAQFRLVEVPTPVFYEVDKIDTTNDRGGGFGSSGK